MKRTKRLHDSTFVPKYLWYWNLNIPDNWDHKMAANTLAPEDPLTKMD